MFPAGQLTIMTVFLFTLVEVLTPVGTSSTSTVDHCATPRRRTVQAWAPVQQELEFPTVMERLGRVTIPSGMSGAPGAAGGAVPEILGGRRPAGVSSIARRPCRTRPATSGPVAWTSPSARWGRRRIGKVGMRRRWGGRGRQWSSCSVLIWTTTRTRKPVR